MNRPYIICHMVTSIDGKVTGDFLFRNECESATEVYYDLNRSLKTNGFICGRVTMEESFTKGWYPNLSEHEAVSDKADYIPDGLSGFYAVAFDSKGRLGWETNTIIDDDPGYGGAQIIEILTNQADSRYLGYLREKKIPYIFAGKNEINVPLALEKLKNLMGAESLLLEGGSVINGAFERAGCVDELSLVIAPVIADKDSKPLFADSVISDYKLVNKNIQDDVIWLNYKKASPAASREISNLL